MRFDLGHVGVQWAMRMLAHLSLTGELSIEDEWGQHTLWVKEGKPVDALFQTTIVFLIYRW